MDGAESRDTEWFKTAFGRLYPLVYNHRDDASAVREAEQLMKTLGLPSREIRVLDVCCGAGRHTAALRSMGFSILGIDLSMNLLEQAGARRELSGLLARGDMRALPFGTGFDLVLNLFTSFGYFLKDEENEQALAEMVRVLKTGGCLVMDHMNKPAVEKGLVARDSEERKGLRIVQGRRIEGNRVMKDIRVETDQGDVIHLEENVRLYSPPEMGALLEAQGLEGICFYGSFIGEPLVADSKRMIVKATKVRG